jgi:hypothetical protein
MVWHHWEYMWCLHASIHKHGVGRLYRLVSNEYSHDSFPDCNNLFPLQCCNYVFMSVLSCENGLNIVYRHYLLHCTLIDHDARFIIVDAALMVILEMGQRACHLLIYQSRWPMFHFFLTALYRHSNNPGCNTYNHEHLGDAHCQDG